MVEVSTSILNIEKENILGAIYNLEVAKTDYFHIKDVISSTQELVPAGFGDGKIDKLVDMIDKDVVLTLEPHLAIFSGYANIDNTEMKNKFTFSSNQEAFDTAVNAFCKSWGWIILP